MLICFGHICLAKMNKPISWNIDLLKEFLKRKLTFDMLKSKKNIKKPCPRYV